MRALPLLLGLALALAGCNSLKLRSADGALSTDAKLGFRETVVGYSRTAAVHVRNGGASRHTAEISIDGPFSAPATLELPGGAVTDIPVTFTPGEPGDAHGTLTLTSDGQALTVSLSAKAVEPVPCSDGPACHARHLDPDQNLCVDQVLPDGSGCNAGGCIEDGQCRGGVCVGQAASCDDGNACTADACDATRGCLHLDLTASCPVPSDPCKVASCDPSSGCGISDAPDGTVCGSVSCDSAHICLLGSCHEVSVPDGYPCAPQTPCQGQGTCQSKVCVQPAMTDLQPAWTYAPAADESLTFNGVLDAVDDLYWVECRTGGDAGCDLVSGTRDGFVRYRAQLGSYYAGSGYGGEGMLASGDDLVLAISGGGVQARSTRDGSLRWAARPAARWTVPLPDGGSLRSASTTGLAALHDGTLAVRLDLAGTADAGPEMLVALLEPDGGGTRAVVELASDGSGAGLVVDGYGRTWTAGDFDLDDAGLAPLAVAIDPLGEVVERRASAGYAVVGVFGDALLMTDGSTASLSFSDGGALSLGVGTSGLPWYGGLTTAPVGLGHLGYAVGGGYACELGAAQDPNQELSADLTGPCGQSMLTRFDPVTGDVIWTTDDGGWSPAVASQPMLTDLGAVLFATDGVPYYDASTASVPVNPDRALVAYDPAGHQLFACELADAGSTSWLGGSALGRERWFVARTVDGVPRLEAYDVPGARPAPHGWVTLAGTPGQEGRAR